MRLSSTSLILSLSASTSCGIRCLAYVTATNNHSQTSAFLLSASGTIHDLAKSTGTLSSSSRSSVSSSSRLYSASSSTSFAMPVDPEYPGTAVERMLAARSRITNLTKEELNSDWEEVRRKLLWAGGLKDLPTSIPGKGYTGHSFNDYNHVDLTCMLDQVSNNENDGTIKEIARGNLLGPGIRIASLPELGPGGSWSTCANGCNQEPPQDVAHLQFRSRIAFKLVWCPTKRFDAFVLVDDDGKELARGSPTGSNLPHPRERQANYKMVAGSKYATAADKIAQALDAVTTE